MLAIKTGRKVQWKFAFIKQNEIGPKGASVSFGFPLKWPAVDQIVAFILAHKLTIKLPSPAVISFGSLSICFTNYLIKRNTNHWLDWFSLVSMQLDQLNCAKGHSCSH